MILRDVFDKHDIRHVDFMVLDLEGAELEALEGMDFEACRIDRILVEALSGPKMLDGFLAKHGFRRSAQFTHRDFLYRPV